MFRSRRNEYNGLVHSRVFPVVELKEAANEPLEISIPTEAFQKQSLSIHVGPSYTQGALSADCMRIKYEAKIPGHEFKIKSHLRPNWDRSRNSWVYDPQTLVLKTQKVLTKIEQEQQRRQDLCIARKKFLNQAQEAFGVDACTLVYTPSMTVQINTKYVKGHLSRRGDNVFLALEPKIFTSVAVTDINTANIITRLANELYSKLNKVVEEYRLNL